MAETRTTEQIPQWKREEVEELVELLDEFESVGVVDVTGIPSRQLQEMRRTLHGSAVIRMSRNTLLARALQAVDEGAEDLEPYLTGHVGLLVSNENPFALYRRLEETKTPAPIGAGEVAPDDIVIEAGDTGMDPGPFVGDLQSVGANARIQDGSIQVLEDSLVCEAGEEVSQDLAGVLNELGIEPKEVGLDLRALVADGVLFEGEDLELDVEEYRADLEAAAAGGRNLSVNAAILTDRTAPALLSKARGEAMAVALEAAIVEADVVPDLVSRADAQVRSLAAAIDDEEALPEELRDVSDAQPDDQPAETPADADEPEGDAAAEDADAAAEDEGDDDDEDDGGDAAEGLGEMFG